MKKDEGILTWAIPSTGHHSCTRYSNNNVENTADFTGDIYNIIPTLEDHVGDFDEEGNFRQDKPHLGGSQPETDKGFKFESGEKYVGIINCDVDFLSNCA